MLAAVAAVPTGCCSAAHAGGLMRSLGDATRGDVVHPWGVIIETEAKTPMKIKVSPRTMTRVSTTFQNIRTSTAVRRARTMMIAKWGGPPVGVWDGEARLGW
jgi:hypothetical protein